MAKKNYQLVYKWVTITEKNGMPGKRKLRVKVYHPIARPEVKLYAIPSGHTRRGHTSMSSEGLGGNLPFAQSALDSLGPNWWQFGGGGL